MQMRQPVVRMISTLLVLGASAGCGMRSTLGETDQSLTEDDDSLTEDKSGAEGLVPCGGGVSPCDPYELGDATCESVGAGSGDLACDPEMCLYDTSMCSGDYAGGVGGTGATATGGTDLFGDILDALLTPAATGGDAAPDPFQEFFDELFGDPNATGGAQAPDPFQEFFDGLFGQTGGDSEATGGDSEATGGRRSWFRRGTEETGGVTETGGTEEVDAGTDDGLE